MEFVAAVVLALVAVIAMMAMGPKDE